MKEEIFLWVIGIVITTILLTLFVTFVAKPLVRGFTYCPNSPSGFVDTGEGKYKCCESNNDSKFECLEYKFNESLK